MGNSALNDGKRNHFSSYELTMKQYAKKYAVTFGIFIIVDLIWLGIIAQPLYEWAIGDFLASSPQWWAAIMFYLLFVVGILYFAVDPALKAKQAKPAAINGALFGFMTYMTYELTNYAVLEGWSLAIVPIDIAWGTILAASTAMITFRVLHR